MNGPESRESLARSLKEVFKNANEIPESGNITTDENRVNIEPFLGGDYKVQCNIIANSLIHDCPST